MPVHVTQLEAKPRQRTQEDEEEEYIPPDSSEEDEDMEFGEVEVAVSKGGGRREGGEGRRRGEEEGGRLGLEQGGRTLNEPVIPNNLLRIRPYRFRYSKRAWKHVVTTGLREPMESPEGQESRKPPCSRVRIITWNIDMVSKFHEARLRAALRHIEIDVLKSQHSDMPPEPCVIMLQEVRDDMLPVLLADEWVRRWFIVAPTRKDKWPEGAWYGIVTLVSRSLSIAECHILHFGLSMMHRTALCVKVRMTNPSGEGDGQGGGPVVVAFVNTHLESLVEGSMARPRQLEVCARFLKLKGVQGGVVCGDMNAITPDDTKLAKEMGLKDAWTRRDDVEDGHTWGYQGQNDDGHPTNRLDKVLYLPGTGYKVDEPKRIGRGVTIREGAWISDHYGLETTLHLFKSRSNSA